MLHAGKYHTLRVLKLVDFGAYLDGRGSELLLPKRFLPAGLKQGDEIRVFVYHDSENRLIATTQHPKGIVGEVVMLEVVSVTPQGAFLDWGLMKDLFIALSQQRERLRKGQRIPVMIYLDKQTGRVAATQKFSQYLSNEEIHLKEMDQVDLFIHRRTDLGFEVIINNRYTGLMHYDDVYQELQIGDKVKGYIKTIRPDNKIDVMPGMPGYSKVENETDKILRLLRENGGSLSYHDKSDPAEVRAFFGMSKKTFKMALGALYKQRLISLENEGIHLLEAD
jgi:predicted RNA-binding protein (virulence factor B family)